MRKKRLLLTAIILILLLAFCLEERRPYEVLHSTVMSSANLTEHKMTLVIHSLLPVDRKKLAEEVVEDSMRLSGGQPNPYFELEIYRTKLHYQLNILYDTFLCNKDGEIVEKINLTD